MTLVLAVLATASATASPARAQSELERTPDLGGTWVGEPGVLHFHFLHRFEATPAPARKVLNSPTFLLGASLPGRTMIGARYATNSLVATGYPNEWEFFGRWAPIASGAGPAPLALHAGWNLGAKSADAELSGTTSLGRLRLLAAVRGFSAPYDGDEARGAVAAGGVLRVHEWLALAGDVGTLFEREAGEEIAWSAGVQLRIPYTPHTLSLQASNANTTTLEGASRGTSRALYGFEFTVPLTLSRWFGAAPSNGGTVAPGDTVTAEVEMSNRLVFGPDTVRVHVGESVRWRNTSDIQHTVTADPRLVKQPENVRLPNGAATFDSGPLDPGAEFVHRFDVAGEYRYFCVPHELAGMVATVIVEP